MNELKRNIIYQFIVSSIILVIISIYLWWGYRDISPWASSRIFGGEITSKFIFGGFAFIIQIILFAICAYWFYSKVSNYIEEETKKQLKEKNQLFANIAHDLKSPMTAVIGLSRALEEGIITEEQQKEVAHTITEKCKHMNKMINLMFQYAKLDTVSYELHRSEVDIARLLKEYVAQRYDEFESKEMELNLQIPNKKIIFLLDQLEFTRVLDNLVTNVIRHNPQFTRVQIGLEEADKYIKVWVADSGEKISKEIQETIFNPFICGDESRNTKGGSGLGLAITKKIVEKHNGQIFIDENIDGYTKAFIIKVSK